MLVMANIAKLRTSVFMRMWSTPTRLHPARSVDMECHRDIGLLDRHMEKIARAMGFDPIDFRLKNAIRPGEYHPFSTAWNEGREPRPEIVHTVGLEQCVAQGRATIGWDDKYGNEEWRKNVSSIRSQGSGKSHYLHSLTPRSAKGSALRW